MSPLPIAIFWRSETSGGVPCIEEGMEVKEGETLCVLEAAKFFNSLPAPVSGVVTRFCFKDQELVKNTQAVCYIRPNP
jgi:biotin carboxyl carrier protein